MTPPLEPVGPYCPDPGYQQDLCLAHITVLRQAPFTLRAAVAGLGDAQLDTRYRNWTIRQIVHHLADSHVNSYIRFKWTLTEERPTIKAYDEGNWAALDDSRTASVEEPLALVEALHARWLQLLESMTPGHFGRSFFHPQSGEEIPLFRALGYYAWHCRHHTGQILWLRQQHGW